MKHGEMGRDLVALRRIMRAAKTIEPSEVFLAELGSNDQRAGH